MDRRRRKRMQRHWARAEAKARAAIDRLDPHSWFDLWHTHVDWNGRGRASAEDRHMVNAVAVRVLGYLEARLAQRGAAVQVWADLSPDTMGTAIYAHSANPNGSTFPFNFPEADWQQPLLHTWLRSCQPRIGQGPCPAMGVPGISFNAGLKGSAWRFAHERCRQIPSYGVAVRSRPPPAVYRQSGCNRRHLSCSARLLRVSQKFQGRPTRAGSALSRLRRSVAHDGAFVQGASGTRQGAVDQGRTPVSRWVSVLQLPQSAVRPTTRQTIGRGPFHSRASQPSARPAG